MKMTAEKTTKRPESVKFEGRVLFLTEDVSLVRRQLEEGVDLEYDPERPLMNNISTDEITPGWVCFYYDETLGEYVYVGMREQAVRKDEVKKGGFAVVVSGLSKGCGSSRETAPFAEKAAGLQLVIARTIEKIYGQNCQNIGLLTSTDFGLIERIRRGEEIPLAEFTRGLDPISQQIVEYGGLFNYNKARLAGHVTPPALETKRRPMNIVEKIVARHAFRRAGQGGGEGVKPRGARPRRARHTPRIGLRLPRPPDVPGPRDAGRETQDGTPRPRERTRHHTGEFHRAAGHKALRRERGRRLGGHLPQRGRRRHRAAGPARHPHGLAHVHGGRARLLRLRRRLDRHGERLVHQRRSHQSPRSRPLRPQRKEARRRVRKGRDARHPRHRLHEAGQRHRAGSGVRGRRPEGLAD